MNKLSFRSWNKDKEQYFYWTTNEESEQFTGFYDIDEANIYHGDFLLDEADETFYLVDWNEESGAWWVWEQGDERGDKGDHGFELAELNPNYCKVVGNLNEGVNYK
jgi:hypothetical protein